jgi:hypothetical protein
VAILTNGLKRVMDYEILDRKISDMASELSGLLTGLLLILALAVTPLLRILATRRARRHHSSNH